MNDVAKRKSGTGFYADKDMDRVMVIMTPAYRNRLKAVSKEHTLSYGEIIEVLLDHMDESHIQALHAKRAEKVAMREGKSKSVLRLDSVPPEKRAAIEAILAGNAE